MLGHISIVAIAGQADGGDGIEYTKKPDAYITTLWHHSTLSHSQSSILKAPALNPLTKYRAAAAPRLKPKTSNTRGAFKKKPLNER